MVSHESGEIYHFQGILYKTYIMHSLMLLQLPKTVLSYSGLYNLAKTISVF